MDRRAQICREHQLRDEAEAYTLVASAAKTGIAKLMAKRLRANVLQELGYSLDAMRKLGFDDGALQQLGYATATPPAEPTAPAGAAAGLVSADEDRDEPQRLRKLLADGWRAEDFRREGYTIHHLKRAQCPLQDLERAGFRMDDFVQVYTAAELRRNGASIRDLRRYFKGQELKQAGFDASDMRNAGFGIRELLGFGYNENQVKTAGFSINELAREGLTRQTVDKRGLH